MSDVIAAQDIVRIFVATRRADPVHALSGVSLSVAAGEMVAIVGPSGSGKSTLLYCLAGLDRPTSGSISVLDADIVNATRTQTAKFRRDHLGFVFQAYNLVPSLSARENVALPARLARRRLSKAAVDDALQAVGVLHRGGAHPAELSGGQQQRVALARVLAAQPDIVFADEPTGALDSKTGAEILRLLRAQASGSRSVVLVTHDHHAASLADRVLVMHDGKISDVLHTPSAHEVFEATEARTPLAGRPE